MPFAPADDRYTRMPYRRTGRSGLLLPAISLGLWWNFGHDRAAGRQQRGTDGRPVEPPGGSDGFVAHWIARALANRLADGDIFEPVMDLNRFSEPTSIDGVPS